ncbi:hypothetical protein E1B28_008190 [Marasmius oreades]|uniref:Uncharacterized protein n=1 Tax=Marasmius oreades TaxID=181124 RepID=A0A9P7RXZ8_9AGAR|nr:uncharacterized protein E1B28_008190 [Marasmius oreades]KAG7091785.1 hypothetical protein E1B28_008190 [Marasmius oreades]
MSAVKSTKTRDIPTTKSPGLRTLIKFKGYADILIGLVIAVKPALLYESAPMKWWHQVSGLHLSDASTAPGFNHAIACMVIAIGYGNVVAARSGPAAWPPVFTSTLTWGILCLLTAASAFIRLPFDLASWGIGPGGTGEINNAAVLMTGFNHVLFCGLMWFLDSDNALRG